MQETWYVLEDGSVVHPSEVDHANMTHKKGKVAMRGDVPATRGVEVDASGKRLYDGEHDHLHENWTGSGNPPKASKPDEAPAKKEAKPEEQSAGYKTRDAKSR